MAERWALTTPWDRRVFMWHNLKSLLFTTRREARDWAREKYGYLNERPDLRRPPHNWRMPFPVRVDVRLVPVTPHGGRGRTDDA